MGKGSGSCAQRISLPMMTEQIPEAVIDEMSFAFTLDEKLTDDNVFENYIVDVTVQAMHNAQASTGHDTHSIGILDEYGIRRLARLHCRPSETPQSLTDLQGHIVQLLRKTHNQKVEYLLEEEYGYLLSRLQNCTYIIQNVPRNRIEQSPTYREQYSHMIDAYKPVVTQHTHIPLGIAIEKDMRYVLVDGNHRYAAAIAAGWESMQLIVASSS